jgi:hypothetical protein
MRNYFATFSLLAATSVFAGSAQVGLDCKSASGLTSVKATLPGDEETYNFEIVIRDQSTKLPYGVRYFRQYLAEHPGDEPRLVVSGVVQVVDGFSHKDKVYAVSSLKEQSESYDQSNTLYALPETVVFKNWSAHSKLVTFKAKLTGFNPRKAAAKDDYPFITDPIVVNCTYEYSI